MLIEWIKEFVKLTNAKKELEAEIKSLKDDLAPLEQAILEEFNEQEVSNMTVDGRVVYLHAQEYVRKCEGVDASKAVAALEAAGMDEYVSYNSQSLSGALRRMAEDSIPVPEELQGVIEMVPTFSIRSRKSTK